MIDAQRLLKDLQRLLKTLEDDLRERVGEVSEIDAALREQYRGAKDAGRTGEAYEVWRDQFLTQAAVAWILGCVFVRFLEDNRLIPTPLLSGPGERRQRALDEHELYFRQPERRTHSDREYLLHVFEQVRGFPAAAELFDAKHNPLWAVGPTGDGATQLLRFWQRVNPDTGELEHELTNADWNTRFLGDLYQDLSEAARKRYALLQTPEFVEEFILDRTLTPAIEEFGFREVRLIDPTCGSGHFLLGAFHRLFDLWVSNEPGINPRELAQRALDQVFGVDINPYAVAIARFRLLIAALKVGGVHSIRREEAPALHVNVAAGDSLLHGRRFLTAADRLSVGGKKSGELDIDSGADQLAGRPGIGHGFFAEDLEALNRILGQEYHAVVGNPPYITVKDKAVNQLYRDRYDTCHRQYSLAVPFTERFFQLAVSGGGAPSPPAPLPRGEGSYCRSGLTTLAPGEGDNSPSPSGRGVGVRGISQPPAAGYVGMITANSFMKREFGKKLIEEFFPRVDLTHVIDTSGAYIPGHGTPTVILFGRDRAPVGETVRTVMGIKGEPATPEDAAKGLVWSAIVSQVDRTGSESEWLSVSDSDRQLFSIHPWSVGGGGATDVKALLDEKRITLARVVESPIGRGVRIGADDAFLTSAQEIGRHRWDSNEFRVFLPGEAIRDWMIERDVYVWYPYQNPKDCSSFVDARWLLRELLKKRATFQGIMADAGLEWFDFMQHTASAYLTPLSVTFSNVATHNHFSLDQAAGWGDGERPPGPDRPAEQLHCLLLDEAGFLPEGRRPRWPGGRAG
jgi:hypothetical protein